MNHLANITAATQTCTANRGGLMQINFQLRAALLDALNARSAEVTNHNANYCTFQGAFTPAECIVRASHFEMIEPDTIMLKQGGQKMRAFKIKSA